jgi:hypothetical protein
MHDLTVERRLVKSPPELWNELSEVDRLAKHLEAFGEIRITKVEPEHTVAWEGEQISGTVSIEASGWGTKVILTAEVPETEPAEPEPAEPEPGEEPEPDEEPDVEPVPGTEPLEEPEPVAVEQPTVEHDAIPPWEESEPQPRRSFLSRWFGGWSTQRPPVPEETPAPSSQNWLEHALAQPSSDTLPEPPPPQPDPPAEPDPEPAPEPMPQPDPEPPPAPGPEQPVAIDAAEAESVLDGVLDTLGAAHHRPFSRG